MAGKGKEFIAGRHPVLEALENGLAVDSVWMSRGSQGPAEAKIRERCREQRIPIKLVPPAALTRIWNGNHQGVIAWRSAVPFYRIADLVPAVYEKGETPLFIMLDGVTDVRNAGAIARSALAAGAHGMIIGTRDVARFNEDAVKASAGALLHLPVCREALPYAIDILRQSGVQVIGAALEHSVVPAKLDLTIPVCLLMGAEGSGIDADLLKSLDHRVRIPQSVEVDSYNVSVAAGILLYEAMRQRGSFS
ncbi:MAG: 23S rRNA (guanosine(2251)-2'-O)-methyltransferase RlmB [Saprospiraceae bacterium]|nr:23S rRNA (guanosine(2251)-2'-O)-methyltransferase RlmB [Saprospiraceae bacterium]